MWNGTKLRLQWRERKGGGCGEGIKKKNIKKKLKIFSIRKWKKQKNFKVYKVGDKKNCQSCAKLFESTAEGGAGAVGAT